MRATQPKLSELAQGELDDTGGRNSNPRLALISPQSAELGRVTKNKEVKNLCGERNIRSGMEISPENLGLWVDSSSNREALNSNFKNQGVNSGLQLSDDPIGVVTSPEFRRDSSLQLCEGIGPPSSETLRESEARITESSRVKLQRISTKKKGRCNTSHFERRCSGDSGDCRNSASHSRKRWSPSQARRRI
ncbi:hypothetical protein U1Q18_001846 [Sarracenia purpurea var. burkii]